MSCDILLVEDNPMDATLAKEALEPAHSVHAVSTLASALSAIEGRRFDLVLLDISLPDAEGTSGIKQLRAAGAPPVVMLSGNLDPDLEQAALHFGAAEFFVKGFAGTDELEAAIAEAKAQQQLPRAEVSGLLTLQSLQHRGTVMQPVAVVVLKVSPATPAVIAVLAEKLARVIPATCAIGEIGEGEFAMLVGDETVGDQMAGMASDHLQREISVDGETIAPRCVLGVAPWVEGVHSILAARRIAAEA